MTMNRPLALLFALSLSGCSITRYYKVQDVEHEIGVMNGQLDATVARMNEDYATKKGYIDGLKKTGADFGKPPFDGIEKSFATLAPAKDAAAAKAAAAQAESTGLAKAIAGRGRVTSDQPEYERVKGFGERAERLNGELNAAFTTYTERSNAFTRLANDAGVFPVDVASFRTRLDQAIADIERQCGEVDGKIADYERKVAASAVEKKSERLALLGAMREDVRRIRGTRTEVESFRSSFRSASKGQKTLVIGPHLPKAELYHSFTSVKSSIDGAVASFNAKVAQYNAL